MSFLLAPLRALVGLAALLAVALLCGLLALIGCAPPGEPGMVLRGDLAEPTSAGLVDERGEPIEGLTLGTGRGADAPLEVNSGKLEFREATEAERFAFTGDRLIGRVECDPPIVSGLSSGCFFVHGRCVGCGVGQPPPK